YTWENCNKCIAAITVEVQQLRIKNKLIPTWECVEEREEAKIREDLNIAKKREIQKLVSISKGGERLSKITFESLLDRNG
ncbi:hypothetical protein FO493_31270, partial [Bacillus paranthracis]|nr:hypothetical protein [Bacillus paranthracis]